MTHIRKLGEPPVASASEEEPTVTKTLASKPSYSSIIEQNIGSKEERIETLTSIKKLRDNIVTSKDEFRDLGLDIPDLTITSTLSTCHTMADLMLHALTIKRALGKPAKGDPEDVHNMLPVSLKDVNIPDEAEVIRNRASSLSSLERRLIMKLDDIYQLRAESWPDQQATLPIDEAVEQLGKVIDTPVVDEVVQEKIETATKKHVTETDDGISINSDDLLSESPIPSSMFNDIAFEVPEVGVPEKEEVVEVVKEEPVLSGMDKANALLADITVVEDLYLLQDELETIGVELDDVYKDLLRDSIDTIHIKLLLETNNIELIWLIVINKYTSVMLGDISTASVGLLDSAIANAKEADAPEDYMEYLVSAKMHVAAVIENEKPVVEEPLPETEPVVEVDDTVVETDSTEQVMADVLDMDNPMCTTAFGRLAHVYLNCIESDAAVTPDDIDTISDTLMACDCIDNKLVTKLLDEAITELVFADEPDGELLEAELPEVIVQVDDVVEEAPEVTTAPIVEEPIVEEPIVEEPVLEEPVVEEASVTEAPDIDEVPPMVEESVEKPEVVDEPGKIREYDLLLTMFGEINNTDVSMLTYDDVGMLLTTIKVDSLETLEYKLVYKEASARYNK